MHGTFRVNSILENNVTKVQSKKQQHAPLLTMNS